MKSEIKKIKVGARGSKLALVQIDEVGSLLGQKNIQIDFETTTYATQGDKDKEISLTENLAEDFFTDTLDQALLDKEVDITIHSAKDLPRKLREGLSIFALTKGLDDTDAFVGNVRFDDLKPGAKIGTSSFVRQQSIKNINPDVDTVDIRGTIEERIRQLKDGKYDGIIVATAALKRLGLDQQIKDIMPWEATPLQGQLAVVGRSEDVELQELFSVMDACLTYGQVTLVGAGPGDPELITVKGVEALRKTDCVFYDYLAHKSLLDYAPQAEKFYVGKRKGVHAFPQIELSKQLKQKAVEGKNIVRLKGGDPLVFGRGAEEIEYLRSYHIDVAVIPGVSSATAIPSSLGIPLTARDRSSSVAFLSGHSKEEKTKDTTLIDIPSVDTIVFLMGLTKLDVIIQALIKKGWGCDAPIIVISKGTCENERIVVGELENIQQKVEEENITPPALIIVGEVVHLWDPQLHAVSKKMDTTLYTGTNFEKYRSFGKVIHFPMIEIAPVHLDTKQVQLFIKDLNKYEMILLTSRFSVRYFFEMLTQNDYPISYLKAKDFIVIGQDTKQALAEYEFEPKLVADIETSEGLFQKMASELDIKGKKILFPRSSLPNPYLKEELTNLGAQVDELIVYQNAKPTKRKLPVDGINKILFTSPSTVRNFLVDYKKIPKDWRILSKGPVTAKSLEEEGYFSDIID